MTQWTTERILAAKGRLDGSNLLVDTKIMVAKANTVSSVISDMEKTFRELQRIVNKTSSYWIGEAGDHHRKLFYDEQEDIDFILIRLKEHPEDLKLMANHFEVTERRLTQMNQQLRSDYI